MVSIKNSNHPFMCYRMTTNRPQRSEGHHYAAVLHSQRDSDACKIRAQPPPASEAVGFLCGFFDDYKKAATLASLHKNIYHLKKLLLG